MTSALGANPLRKLISARDPKGAARVRGGWVDAWRVGVPRVCDEALGVEGGLLAAARGTADLADFLEALPTAGLLMRLTCADGLAGVAHVDAVGLAALLEAMMLGRVTEGQAAERWGTKTDAAIVGPFFDRLLSCADADAAAGPVQPLAGREVRSAGRFADRRAVELGIDPGEVETLSLEIGFAGGAKTGGFRFALQAVAAARSRGGGSGPEVDAVDRAALDAEACLTVVLDRPKVPISWVRGLKEGHRLELPRARLGEARIETAEGHVVARGRVGQASGLRAVRLDLSPGPSANRAALPPAHLKEAAGPGAVFKDGAGGLAAVSRGPTSSDDGGGPKPPEAPPPGLGSDDLPDLPDLSDLPDIAGLPDLPDLPEPA